MHHPFTARIRDTRRRACVTLSILLLAIFLFRVPMFAELTIAYAADGRMILTERTWLASNVAYNVIYYLAFNTALCHVGPFVALCMCCVITVRVLRASHAND